MSKSYLCYQEGCEETLESLSQYFLHVTEEHTPIPRAFDVTGEAILSEPDLELDRQLYLELAEWDENARTFDAARFVWQKIDKARSKHLYGVYDKHCLCFEDCLALLDLPEADLQAPELRPQFDPTKKVRAVKVGASVLDRRRSLV